MKDVITLRQLQKDMKQYGGMSSGSAQESDPGNRKGSKSPKKWSGPNSQGHVKSTNQGSRTQILNLISQNSPCSQ